MRPVSWKYLWSFFFASFATSRKRTRPVFSLNQPDLGPVPLKPRKSFVPGKSTLKLRRWKTKKRFLDSKRKCKLSFNVKPVEGASWVLKWLFGPEKFPGRSRIRPQATIPAKRFETVVISQEYLVTLLNWILCCLVHLTVQAPTLKKGALDVYQGDCYSHEARDSLWRRAKARNVGLWIFYGS